MEATDGSLSSMIFRTASCSATSSFDCAQTLAAAARIPATVSKQRIMTFGPDKRVGANHNQCFNDSAGRFPASGGVNRWDHPKGRNPALLSCNYTKRKQPAKATPPTSETASPA